ncbi:MAG: hypothetical protein ABJI36_06440, partial [Kangiellaceae bacterium]
MKNLLMVSFGLFIGAAVYNVDVQATNLNVEELRLGKAVKAMPEAATQFGSRLNRFSKLIYTVDSYDGASRLIANEGNQLWRTAIDEYAKRKDFDDRPLYWARLKFNSIIKNTKLFAKLSESEQQQLLWISELATRGNSDVEFDKNTRFKILLTGFDPFFLDRYIDQSNPSGVIATAFDNKVFYVGGQAVEVETLIVPVRFEDFDKGMIETMLTPRLQNKQVDMIVTVSMGRDDFDLERFPGLRRSAKAPDNLNVYTGASAETPLVPMYAGKMLKGPEFNQFSLPASAMKLAEGAFKINDNHKVTTKTKSFHPKTLNELEGEVS